jgi:U3 small nucleolar ribonucleoprotein protein IMP3
MRQLKFHEQKLLKKVNFFQWKSENNLREVKVLRRYHVQDRDDYLKYSKVAGLITKITAMLKDLPHDVSFPASLRFYPSTAVFSGPTFLCTSDLFQGKISESFIFLTWQDEVRIKITDALVEKLYNMALIPTKKSLVQCERLAVSAFCRRRLPVVLVRLKFCETMREAVTFVEQGHIRIGELLSPSLFGLDSLYICAPNIWSPC